MWTDVVDLRDFYEGPLGKVARGMIARRLRDFWPDVAGERVLGLGYATPFLAPFQARAERVLATMPAQQGVLPWPDRGKGLASLAEEWRLPFPDLAFDRVLVAHAVEFSEALRPMMREIWRVMAGSGRLIVIVPNRRGLWARFENTPFGHGRPYSSSQLNRLLRENMFTPLKTELALYVPPSKRRVIYRTAPAWERIGARWFNVGAGVTLVEASKEIYATNTLLEKPVRVPAEAVPANGTARVGALERAQNDPAETVYRR